MYIDGTIKKHWYAEFILYVNMLTWSVAFMVGVLDGARGGSISKKVKRVLKN
jgi:hypothetical protein